MYTRQARSAAAVARSQTVEVAITFTPEELKRLEALASQSGFDLSGFVQNAALEAAHLKTPNRSGQGAAVDATWLTEAFQEEPRNITTVQKEPKVEKAQLTKVAVTDDDSSATENSTSVQKKGETKKGVVGEQSTLAKGSGPVWEIRKALGQERLHGLGWTREHLAFVLKLSVVGVRKLEHTGMAPVKSQVAREKLLELAKAIKEPNAQVKRYIEESTK